MILPPVSWLVDASLRVSLMLVLLIAARPWLRCLIGSRAVAALWLLIAVRLLLPWPVESRWALGLQRPITPTREVVTQAPAMRVTVGPRGGQIAPRQPASAVPARSAVFEFWTTLWALGAIIAAARLAHGWRQTRRWAAATSPGEEDPRLAQVYASLPPRLRRGVALRLTDAVEMPTLAGVFRPQIWLPRAAAQRLGPEQLRHVLLHELGHARRRDLLAQWMMALACCVHWFNPLVWLASRLARADRELACDAWVLARTATGQPDFAARYGQTLIHVVQSARAPARALPPAAVAMAAGHRNLTRRVREIGHFQPVPWRRGAAAFTLAAAVVAAGTATRAEPPAPPAREPSGLTPAPAEPEPAASREFLKVQGQLFAVSEAAMQTLLKDKARFPVWAPLLDQWAAAFRQGDLAGETDPDFQQVVAAGGHDQEILDRLQQLDGVLTLSHPRVTFQPGQRATVEMTRELSYPVEFTDDYLPGMEPTRTPKKFETSKLGLTMEMEGSPGQEKGAVAFEIRWNLSELQEYLGAKDRKPVAVDQAAPGDASPVIVSHRISTKLDLTPGATLVLGAFRRKPVLWSVFNFASDKGNDRALLLSFITLSAAKPVGAPPFTAEEVAAFSARHAGSPPPPSPVPDESPQPDLPYGIQVNDKPGFVISPYSPNAGYVDLRGFKRGQQVKDPYTSKMFLAP